MNRKELVSAAAAKAGVTQQDAEAVIKAFTEVVADAMKEGDSLQLIGFGTFLAVDRPERSARNPRTGEKIISPARRVPRFRPGTSLKAYVDGQK